MPLDTRNGVPEASFYYQNGVLRLKEVDETLDEIKSGKDNEIMVLVDNEAFRENVIRAAESQKCRIGDIQQKGCLKMNRFKENPGDEDSRKRL